VTYIPDPHATFTRARNTGIAKATGNAVVFIDDAVDPEAGWVRPLLTAFQREDVAVVYGLSLPASLDTNAQIALEYDPRCAPTHLTPREYGAAFQEGWSRGLPVWQIASGLNMAVRRTHAVALGGFDERLGKGADNAIGPDSELCHRALCAGFTARFEPLSIIRHRRAPDFALLQSQARDLTYRHTLQLFAQYARHGDKGDLARVFLTLPTDYLKRIAHMPRRRLLGAPDRLLVSDIQGYLAGLTGIRLALRKSALPAGSRMASATDSSQADL
jgi:GT2 family glycosyltransferase